ncbi:hypothetical protein ACIBG7_11535 [Nonomuraea sp. NPDC050328]|uniref:hypothetical protein n=1 Tax=Nonomuraea sp. NPDC050328 TaxID=3364361 RepID=UPI0037AF6AED
MAPPDAGPQRIASTYCVDTAALKELAGQIMEASPDLHTEEADIRCGLSAVTPARASGQLLVNATARSSTYAVAGGLRLVRSNRPRPAQKVIWPVRSQVVALLRRQVIVVELGSAAAPAADLARIVDGHEPAERLQRAGGGRVVDRSVRPPSEVAADGRVKVDAAGHAAMLQYGEPFQGSSSFL